MRRLALSVHFGGPWFYTHMYKAVVLELSPDTLEKLPPLSKLAFSAGHTGLGQDEMKTWDGLKAGTKITIREARGERCAFLNCSAHVPAGSSPQRCRNVGSSMLSRSLGMWARNAGHSFLGKMLEAWL